MDNGYIFYGKDLTSIDEAYVLMPNEKTPKRIDSDNKEMLWSFLKECNQKLGDKDESVIIVSHSEGKKVNDEKRKYQLTSEYAPEKNRDSNEEYSEEDNETSERKEYRRFGQLVGTIRGRYKWKNWKKEKDIKLIIFSRFDTVDFKSVSECKPYFLASLLLKGKLKFSKNADVDFNYESLFDFYMIWIMKKHFEDAVLKGFFKKYQRFEKNDDRLRGTIDISRHIKLNMGMDMGRVAYSYRENSMDNMVNHLIISAYDYLDEKYPKLVRDNIDNEIEMQIRSLKYEIGYPKYDRRTIINKNSVSISHPYFLEYKLLQDDCLKILRDEGISPFESEDESISGILYYVPDLWEEYLEDFIESNLREKNRELSNEETDKAEEFSLHIKPQKDIKVMIGMDDVAKDLEKANVESDGHSTYPDYVFSYRKEASDQDYYFFILDAKYKYYWPDALDGRLDSDVLGDYDKCIRDMESVDGTGTGVIFPILISEREKHGYQFCHRFSVYNNFKTFYTLPVIVPDNKKQLSYFEWDQEMRSNISELMKYFANILYYEAIKKMKLSEAEKKISKIMKEYKVEDYYDITY